MRFFVPFILLILTSASLCAEPFLTSENIKNFINAYPQVQTWVKKASAEKRLVFKLVPNNKADMFTQTLIASKLDKEFNTLIKPYGFADSSRYIETESVVKRVYEAVTKETLQAQLHKELKEKLRALDREFAPESKKKERRNQLHQQINAATKRFDVTKEERNTISPYLPQLKKLLK